MSEQLAIGPVHLTFSLTQVTHELEAGHQAVALLGIFRRISEAGKLRAPRGESSCTCESVSEKPRA